MRRGLCPASVCHRQRHGNGHPSPGGPWSGRRDDERPRQEQTILTPSQVGQYIKGIHGPGPGPVRTAGAGELSNYKMYPPGTTISP